MVDIVSLFDMMLAFNLCNNTGIVWKFRYRESKADSVGIAFGCI